MITQHQRLKQLQKLSPLQIQLMRLIHLSSLDMENRVEEEVEKNPVLETEKEKDEIDLDENIQNRLNQMEELPSPFKSRSTQSISDIISNVKYEMGENLFEHLEKQLLFLKLSETDKAIANYIIGNLDESGYFIEPIELSVNNLLIDSYIDTTVEHFEKMLKKIQTLEPSGIAAQNLQECLLIQLYKMEKSENVKHSILVIKKYFDSFKKKHFDLIAQKLKITKEKMQEIVHLLKKLNPKPGRYFENQSGRTEYIFVDFKVSKKDDDIVLVMSKLKIPKLNINKDYLEMFKKLKNNKVRKDRKTIQFLKEKLDNALWFIDAISQRQETLRLTMQGIIDFQKEYFLTGDNKNLKPMILKDIAEKINMDQSTVSRVVNQKFVETDYGTFPLKYFFSESLSTKSGEEVSSKAIKKIITEIIEEENKKTPVSDLKISKILGQREYNVARRTVAKYREQMAIPIARLRKETLQTSKKNRINFK